VSEESREQQINVPVGSIRKARRLLRGVWAAKMCCKAASLVYARPRQDAKMEILVKTWEDEEARPTSNREPAVSRVDSGWPRHTLGGVQSKSQTSKSRVKQRGLTELLSKFVRRMKCQN
jgi:hypothetical protein